MKSPSLSRAARLLVAALVFPIAAAMAAVNAPAPKVGMHGKDAPWVPTSYAVAKQMLDLAKVGTDDFFIDLGSGDGRLVIEAAKRGAHAMGVEYNPSLVEFSRESALKQNVGDHTLFVQGDVFETDFSKATVVSLFMLPETMFKMRSIVLAMKPGTRVVSNSFKLGPWFPDETRRVVDECPGFCEAHLWIVPAQVNGEWLLPGGKLRIEQHYQKLLGSLVLNGRSRTLADGHMKGAQISFRIGNQQYLGMVSGDRIEGTMRGPGASSAWTAQRPGS